MMLPGSLPLPQWNDGRKGCGGQGEGPGTAPLEKGPVQNWIFPLSTGHGRRVATLHLFWQAVEYVYVPHQDYSELVINSF